MTRTLERFVPMAVATAILTIGCTPSVTPKDPFVEPQVVTTTTVPTTNEDGELLPPQRGESSAVAEDALRPVPAFTETSDPPQTTEDLLFAIESWLPGDLVAGEAQTVYERSDGATVAVVSVIPQLTWRGDPGFVPSLIQALTGADPDSPTDGIFTAHTDGGATMELWSTGDGFVVAASHDDPAAVEYLSGLAQATERNQAWTSGDCLFIGEDEDLPYAPFPPDVVVPCDGAHNAEVLFGSTTGANVGTFDEQAIEDQRNYDCDRSYNGAFGDQRTHAPGLVTYMPDEDEWDRGDRYIACVVIIDRNEGRQLIAGDMAERDDLVFEPAIGSCLLDRLPADTVDCSTAHIHQYIGDASIDVDIWPDADDSVFDDACAPLLDDLKSGPADLNVFAIGLGPYAFDNGDRTVRCMAFATFEDFIVDVLGSFEGSWRVVGQGGIPA